MVTSLSRIKQFIFIVMMAAMFAVQFATADVDKTSIAVSFNEISGIRAGGIKAAVPYDVGAIHGSAQTTAQLGGGLIRGTFHLEANFDVDGWDIGPYADGGYKGYGVSNLAQEINIGIKAEAPEQLVGDMLITGGLGIFGQNAGEWAGRTARDDLEQLGTYSFDQLDGLNDVLTGLKPAPRGIPLNKGNDLNLLVYMEVQLSEDAGISINGMPQLTGDVKAHQLSIEPHVHYDVTEVGSHDISLDMSLELLLQFQGGETYSETAMFGGISITL